MPRQSAILGSILLTALSCLFNDSTVGAATPDGSVVATTSVVNPLPGLISHPVPLSGNRRWQMYCKHLRPVAGAVGWSPDGRWLAVASGRAVPIFDATGVPDFQKVLVGHTDFVRAVHFSPNGELIATASIDGTAIIWDQNGREKTVFLDHDDAVQDVAWHPDGQLLASASLDGTVRIWTVEGKAVATMSDHEAPVNAVAWSPDGKWLASGCQNKIIRYWSADGKPGPIAEGHVGSVESLAWKFDSSQLLSCDHGIEASDESESDVAHIKVWDVAGRQVDSAAVDRPLTHVCWSPDGTRALAAASRAVFLWPVADRKQPTVFAGAGQRVPVAWRPTGDLIAVGPQLHDANGRSLNSVVTRNIGLMSVSANADGSVLGVGRNTQMFYLYSHDGQQLHESPALSGGQLSVTICWHPDGKSFFPIQRYSPALQQYDVTGNKIGVPLSLPSPVRSAEWSRDGKFLAAGGDGRMVLLVNLETSASTSLGKHLHGITQVRFTPDQQRIVSAGFDSCVRIWTRDGKSAATLEAVSAPIRGLAIAGDGKLIASGHEDATIRLWDDAGESINVLGGHGGFVEALDFSPDGQRLVSASADNSVRIWNRDGLPLSTLRGHEGTVFGAQWAPDNRHVYSCADDGTVRRWDTETGVAEWQALLGESGGYVTLDSQGRIKHGNEAILESDFVFFVENEQGQLVRTDWKQLRSEINPGLAAASQPAP